MIITIFDFDDTLFATSHFGSCPVEDDRLVVSIDALLKTAATMGDIIIVTNATMSWVKLCAEKYLSKSEYLKMFWGRIFSTVDSMSELNNTKVDEWKKRAFGKVLKPFFKNKEKHTLFCFGDSKFDRDAALSIRKKYKNVTVKSVLLVQRPTLNMILYQHYLIYNFLNSSSSSSENIDICFNLVSSSTSSEIIQKSFSSESEGTLS